eukprot:9470305-Pyramimonas_sp.AAC.1
MEWAARDEEGRRLVPPPAKRSRREELGGDDADDGKDIVDDSSVERLVGNSAELVDNSGYRELDGAELYRLAALSDEQRNRIRAVTSDYEAHMVETFMAWARTNCSWERMAMQFEGLQLHESLQQ